MSTTDVTSDFAPLISAATRTIHEPRSVDETLRTIAEVTHNSVPRFDQVGIMGQAIGILMERHNMNDDRAFAFLVRAASHTNVTLRAVAQELVDVRNSSVATE